jgi:hypothetical protein
VAAQSTLVDKHNAPWRLIVDQLKRERHAHWARANNKNIGFDLSHDA